MAKKILLIALPTLAFLFFVVYYYFFYIDAQNIGTSAFKAIQPEASLIIKINNPAKTIEYEKKEHLFYKSLRATLFQNSENSAFSKSIAKVELTVELLSQITDNRSIIGQFNLINESEVESVYFVELESIKDGKIFLRNLQKNRAPNSGKRESQKFNGAVIYEHLTGDGKNTLSSIYLTLHKGLFITSYNIKLIEKAIQQLNSSTSVDLDESFSKVYKTASNESELNIFINHKTAHEFSKSNKNISTSLFPYSLSNFAKWTVLDVSHRHNKLYLCGFSSSNSNENNYEQLFRNQAPQQITIDSYIPSKALNFKAFAIPDIKKFESDLAEYEDRNSTKTRRKFEHMAIEDSLKFNVSRFFKTYFENEIAYVDLLNETQISNVWVIKVNDSDKAMKELQELQHIKFKEIKNKKEQLYSTFSLDNETEFKIYKSPINNLSSLIFGEIVPNFNSTYYASYKNCLVFSNEESGITQFLHRNIIGETLKNEPNYIRFKSNFSTKINYLLYQNPAFLKALNNIDSRRKPTEFSQKELDFIGWNFTNTNGMVYHEAQFQVDSTTSIPHFDGWKTFLDTIPLKNLQIVVNSEMKTDVDICVQDSINNLYLINSVGRILFKFTVDNPIIGEIKQLDYFKNGKLQLLFNTEDHIYIIDRKGKNVGKSPYKLATKASNELTVYDYENDKDYRIFVAGQNNTIYSFSKEGNPIKGWKPFVSMKRITRPIQFFRVDRKDYIVFTDESKIYMLDRKGNQRVIFNDNFNFSEENTLQLEPKTAKTPSRLVTTDKNGGLLFFNFSGKTETMKVGQFSEKHIFKTGDFDNDGKKDYLFSDTNSIQIFNYEANKLFSISDSTLSLSIPIFYNHKDKGCNIVAVDNQGRVHFINNQKLYTLSTAVKSTKICVGFVQTLQPGFRLFSTTNNGFLMSNQLP